MDDKPVPAWAVAAGELARPAAIYLIALAVAFAIVRAVINGKGTDVLVAGGSILTVIYGAKAAEVAVTNRANAQVKIAAGPNPPPPSA